MFFKDAGVLILFPPDLNVLYGFTFEFAYYFFLDLTLAPNKDVLPKNEQSTSSYSSQLKAVDKPVLFSTPKSLPGKKEIS